jgi:hypothetical protein
MIRFSHIVPAIALLTLTLSNALGAGLDPRDISADARWVAHLDADRFRETTLGRHIQAKMTTDRANEKIEAFKAIFQFDPRSDVQSLTMYGISKEKKDGVLLLHGRFNTDQLVTLVKANEHYSSSAHGTQTIHSWIDKKRAGKRTYGCVARSNQIVIGDNEALVKQAVDVLLWDADNMAGSTALPGLADATESTFFIGAADMKGMPDMGPRAAMLSQSEALSVSFAEVGGTLNCLFRMVATDAAAATSMHSIAQGLIGLTALNANQEPDLVKLAQALKLTIDGNQLLIKLDYPVADMIRIMQACKEKRAKHCHSAR